MSKKKFSVGFDTIFNAPVESTATVDTKNLLGASLGSNTMGMEIPEKKVLKRPGIKNFTNDLDSLFKDAFTEAVEEKIDKMRRQGGTGTSDNNMDIPRKPLSGLDALIRSTVDASLAELQQATIKRLTIVVENQKVEKLKSIARMERSFMKDIISSVLNEFIENYEQRTGKSLL